MEQIDILDRQQFVDDVKGVIRLLSEGKKNVTFAINGQWGVGKTFVLNMLEEQLKDDYIVFHFNAWEYDYYDEPLVALLTSTAEQLKAFETDEKTAKQIGKAVLKTAAKTLIKIVGEISKNKLGVNIPEVVIDICDDVNKQKKKTKVYDTYLDITEKIGEVKKQLQKLSEIKTIVFIVDELDRCLPEYAIKTLERLHHVFTGVENLQVILSVDKTQLRNTVKTIFGDNVEFEDYLKKFIKFSIKLPIGDINSEKFDEKFSKYNSHFELLLDITKKEDVNYFVKNLLRRYDTRTKINIVDKALFLHSLLPDIDKKRDLSYMCLELLLVVCAKEKYLSSERKNDSPVEATFLSCSDFRFFYNKIQERDGKRKRYVRYSFNESYGEDDQVFYDELSIHIIDIWSLLWFNICKLYGGEISKNTTYTFVDNIGKDVNLDEYRVYENKFIRLCTFIR